jgi:N-acetylglucosamine-6-phosphate deacetylase
MIDLVRQMVDQVGVPLWEVVRMATETPARAMGWKNKGILEVGTDADLVVISPELEVVSTYCDGRLTEGRASARPFPTDSQ